jgi:hypothetical protein
MPSMLDLNKTILQLLKDYLCERFQTAYVPTGIHKLLQIYTMESSICSLNMFMQKCVFNGV